MFPRILLYCLALASAGQPGALVKEFIFISAPFASAHASNLVELRNGDLLASWFGGSAEGQPDVAIWMSRHTAGGWSTPIVLVREPGIACFNPVIFYTQDRRLWLYYKFGAHPSDWSAGRRSSDDEGKTWSPVEHLPAGLYGPIRTKPLLLPDGVVISGSSVESYLSWACWIERSSDNGKSWQRIGPITVPFAPSPNHTETPLKTYGIIQPSVVSLGGNKLRLYARSTSQIGRICIADSNDRGLSWTPARPIDLPNPNSGIDAVRLRDGRIVIAYNNASAGRTPLNLAVSPDGEHFSMFSTLEDASGEYSYPSLLQARNDDLYLTYTWNRQRIRFVRFPLSAVPK